jgi:hypothetical protein
MDDGTTRWGILGVVGDQWLAGQTSDEHRFINVVRNRPTAVFAVAVCAEAATNHREFVATRRLGNNMSGFYIEPIEKRSKPGF